MLTKEAQLKRNVRLKEKPLKDKAYLKWLHEVKRPHCFVCGKRNGIELHHVKDGSSDVKNDHMVIPLCGVEHHRLGTELSAHGTPKKFREVFPVQSQRNYAKILYNEYKETK